MKDCTYGHTDPHKAIDLADVYGIGFDAVRAARRPVRLGIIGAGAVVQSKHWPAIKRLQAIWEPIEVAAFALRSENQARKVEKVFGGRWYRDYRDMLASERLDGVLVCSPDEMHCEHTIACLDRGLPVLVEKPIARSLVDAERMCRLAESKNVPLLTVANKRFSPPYWKAKRFIIDGPVSNPAMIVGKFNLGYDYVDLFESGTIHLFDMVRHLMGDVSRVRCVGVNRYGRCRRNYPVDNAVAQLELASGAVGSVTTSSSALSFKPWERVEVYADHAWLDVDDQCRLTLHDKETDGSRSWTPVVPNTLLFDEEFGGYLGLIESFSQTIRGVEAPLIGTWEGYRAYEVLMACELSLARGGAAVDLPLEPHAADEEAHAWLSAAGWPGGAAQER